jgi:hypothetical protein
MTSREAAGRPPLPGGLLEGPQFGVRKTWVDPVPGIEMVQIHYTWSPVGQEPDWEQAESVVLVNGGDHPGLRSAVIDVPRSVSGEAEYLLHHFFFVIRGTDRSSSSVVSEVVTPHEAVYEDHGGSLTHVGIVWGVVPHGAEGLTAPNYTTASLDGLDFVSDEASSEMDTAAHMFEFVRSQPLPHVFRGRMWGPRGCRVQYMFHLVTSGSPDPADDVERWDDNGGQSWRVDL